MRRANVGHGLGPVSRSSGCAGGARTCSTIGGTAAAAAAAAAAARGQRTAKTRGNRERQRQEENGTTRRTPPASNSAANAHLPRRRGRVGSLGPECHSLLGAEDVLPRQLRPGSQCVGGSNRSRQAVTRGGRVPFSDMLGILGRRTTLSVRFEEGRPAACWRRASRSGCGWTAAQHAATPAPARPGRRHQARMHARRLAREEACKRGSARGVGWLARMGWVWCGEREQTAREGRWSESGLLPARWKGRATSCVS